MFDSGVGGLTVVRALMERLPFEEILYFGDTARVPYGVKSVETITAYARQITDFLLGRNVKLLIIACNTMAAVARPAVAERSPVPVLDVIDAGARAAVRHPLEDDRRDRNAGHDQQQRLCAGDPRYDREIRVYSQACPLFVPLVEEGWFDHPVTHLTAREYLKPVLAEGIDTLVLGCTHYPLLKPLLQEEVGAGITLIDSAEAMADITANLLAESGLGNPRRTAPGYRFFVTDVPYRFQTIGEQILGRTLSHVEIVRW